MWHYMVAKIRMEIIMAMGGKGSRFEWIIGLIVMMIILAILLIIK